MMSLDQLLPNLLPRAKELMVPCSGQCFQVALVNSHRRARCLCFFHCLLIPQSSFYPPCGLHLASAWVTLPHSTSPMAAPRALNTGRRVPWEAVFSTWPRCTSSFIWMDYSLSNRWPKWTRVHTLSLDNNFPKEDSDHVYQAISLPSLSLFLSSSWPLHHHLRAGKGQVSRSSSALSAPS